MAAKFSIGRLPDKTCPLMTKLGVELIAKAFRPSIDGLEPIRNRFIADAKPEMPLVLGRRKQPTDRWRS